jgi:hypothetical protein
LESRTRLISVTIALAAAVTTAHPPVSRAASTRLVESQTEVLAPDSVTVGERFGVRHTFTFPDTLEMSVPSDFEPGSCRVVSLVWRAAQSDGSFERTAEFTLMTLDLEEARFPGFAVDFVTPAGDTLVAFADEVVIPVRQLAGPGAEARPLKAQWIAPRNYWKWIALIAAMVAALALLMWWLRRRSRRIEDAPPEPKLPADYVALQELTRIEKLDLLEKGEFKRYYTLVTDAVRRYIENRFLVEAMDRTTGELLDALADRGQRVDKLDGLLREADLVKFAKHVPGEDDGTAAMSAAREIVVKTTPRRIVPDGGGSPGQPAAGDDDQRVHGTVEAR